MTRWVAIGPRGGRQPVEPIKAPDGSLYWCRTAPWPRFKGLSESEDDLLGQVGTRNELVPEEEE